MDQRQWLITIIVPTVSVVVICSITVGLIIRAHAHKKHIQDVEKSRNREATRHRHRNEFDNYYENPQNAFVRRREQQLQPPPPRPRRRREEDYYVRRKRREVREDNDTSSIRLGLDPDLIDEVNEYLRKIRKSRSSSQRKSEEIDYLPAGSRTPKIPRQSSRRLSKRYSDHHRARDRSICDEAVAVQKSPPKKRNRNQSPYHIGQPSSPLPPSFPIPYFDHDRGAVAAPAATERRRGYRQSPLLPVAAPMTSRSIPKPTESHLMSINSSIKEVSYTHSVEPSLVASPITTNAAVGSSPKGSWKKPVRKRGSTHAESEKGSYKQHSRSGSVTSSIPQSISENSLKAIKSTVLKTINHPKAVYTKSDRKQHLSYTAIPEHQMSVAGSSAVGVPPRPQRPARPDRPDRPERPERPDRPDRPDRLEKHDRSGRHEKAERQSRKPSPIVVSSPVKFGSRPRPSVVRRSIRASMVSSDGSVEEGIMGLEPITLTTSSTYSWGGLSLPNTPHGVNKMSHSSGVSPDSGSVAAQETNSNSSIITKRRSSLNPRIGDALAGRPGSTPPGDEEYLSGMDTPTISVPKPAVVRRSSAPVRRQRSAASLARKTSTGSSIRQPRAALNNLSNESSRSSLRGGTGASVASLVLIDVDLAAEQAAVDSSHRMSPASVAADSARNSMEMRQSPTVHAHQHQHQQHHQQQNQHQSPQVPKIAGQSAATRVDNNKLVYKAMFPYSPQLPDELELKVGDILRVFVEFDDGWCFARIYHSKQKYNSQEGMCPMACLAPYRIVLQPAAK